ncbi:hypothetical protein ACL03H_01450 [Saccharopolyspora sp. MS10]|uniref:hypothetical protein n=1 Tax=Saccharopolyspora sp. MS10 TaxID=3385973 RepID=UPI0039A3B402
MLTTLRNYGVRSDHLFIAGMVSIGLSVASWASSRKAEDVARADRWGIFVGEWAPTFFALGAALRIDETHR